MTSVHDASPARPVQRFDSQQLGFTQIELLVTLVVAVIVLAGALQLFESSVRMSREQIHVADMQQSVRVAQHEIVRYVRMAGRGGLPRQHAVLVRNAAAADANIAVGDATSPSVLEDSDVLILRGVFSAPLYQTNPAAGGLVVTLDTPTTGTVTVTNPSPTGVPQDLASLEEAVREARPEAILLVSGLGESIYAVVELVPGQSDASLYPESVTLGFRAIEAFDAISAGGAFDPNLQTAAHVGILEEQRFYIREEYAAVGGDLTPHLARDRFYPNTETIHPDSPGIVADNLLDLQIALGVDVDGNGSVDESTPPDDTDEWQGNHEDDGVLSETAPLYYVRVSTLARTDRRDLDYISPPIASIEDHAYGEPELPSALGDILDRRFRRRLLIGTVELRNL